MQTPPSLPLAVIPDLLPPPRLVSTCAAVTVGLASAAIDFHAYTQSQRSRRRPRPRQGGHRITKQYLKSLSDEDCLWRFRFTAADLITVVDALKIPPSFTTRSHHRFTGLEAFALTLARFRSEGELDNLSILYDRSHSALSEAVNYIVEYVDRRWHHLLDFDSNGLLHPTRLEAYARAIHRHGAPLWGVWGFIDCTIRRIARPSWYQRVAYNGYKKFHALKYQAIMLPNGMIGHLFGPMEGRRGDLGLLDESKLVDTLKEKAIREGVPPDGPAEMRFLQLFGDPAYGVSYQILSPFMAEVRTAEEVRWNEMMGSVRVRVEHGFGQVSQKWPFLDAHSRMRVFASPVGIYYMFGVLMTNILNCFEPNSVATSFCCSPPTLAEYLHDESE